MELLIYLGLLLAGAIFAAFGYHEKNIPTLVIGGSIIMLLGIFMVAEGISYTAGTLISINQTNDSTTTYTTQSETLIKTDYKGSLTSNSFGLILWAGGFVLIARGVFAGIGALESRREREGG